MDNKITELTITNADKTTLFSDENEKYVIPLYQRAYAWKEKEIEQLIDDICDCDSEKYFIGSLIVDKKSGGEIYEVIDGQQRLTTLFLLLKCLSGYDVKNILTFECRERSNHSLKYLDIPQREDEIEFSILRGKEIIIKRLNESDVLQKLQKNLTKVRLYRIEVPDKTDLNRYFEIMNTRGEQLEQHDILKANLMEEFDDIKQDLFADVWEACSDMTGYVQMHFDKSRREKLFGSRWWDKPETGFFKKLCDEEMNGDAKNNKKKNKHMDILSIINEYSSANNNTENDDDKHLRFESIIEFPYFLLHILRLFVEYKKIYTIDGEKMFDRQLDDKKLLDDYKNVIEKGYINGIKLTKTYFSEHFIEFLLQMRFVFDNYILKREYTDNEKDGHWSLKYLCVSGQGSNKKAYYKETTFKDVYNAKWDINRKDRVLYLQACYRVSYTSPKIMHWITEALKYCNNVSTWNEYEIKLEKIAQKAVYDTFISKQEYEAGVNTQHIVFNYLDYLLWKQNQKKYSDFIFEFRNSVEHWYPQNPSKDTFDEWKQYEGVNRFGNLCLIQREVNAKFSNMSPEAKKSTYEKMISKGSIKLKLMADLTIKQEGKNANTYWKENACEEHEEKMLSILKEACKEFYNN